MSSTNVHKEETKIETDRPVLTEHLKFIKEIYSRKISGNIDWMNCDHTDFDNLFNLSNDADHQQYGRSSLYVWNCQTAQWEQDAYIYS